MQGGIFFENNIFDNIFVPRIYLKSRKLPQFYNEKLNFMSQLPSMLDR